MTDVKKLIQKYLMGVAWYLMYKDDPEQKKRIDQIVPKLKDLKKILLANDVPEEKIRELNRRASMLINTPEDKLSFESYCMLVQIIFT